jgi:hypothetical protein
MTMQEPSYEERRAAFEASTANLRAELARRSVEQIAYDDYVLTHLRKRGKFKIALRKANQKFPGQALDPEQAKEIDDFYISILHMMAADHNHARVLAIDERQKQLQKRIVELEQLLAEQQKTKTPPST